MTTKQRYDYVVEYFSKTMPTAESELNFRNPFELLVAVVLSAQCTDKRVNLTTPALFERYPDATAMAEASEAEIYEYIKSISYPNNKAKHLATLARQIVERFGGEVPSDPDDLQSLQGVGRKTANVVGAVLWGREVMPVDTHVFRVAARIGLSRNAKTPLATERQLEKGFPKELLPLAHHWLILHGRYTCMARKPKCEKCGLTAICKHYITNNKQ
ncbi:MAG: endonuclease III [Rikenellaceae bacterium]|nr:endonuclease III [Rikenellaceae bacterium]